MQIGLKTLHENLLSNCLALPFSFMFCIWNLFTCFRSLFLLLRLPKASPKPAQIALDLLRALETKKPFISDLYTLYYTYTDLHKNQHLEGGRPPRSTIPRVRFWFYFSTTCLTNFIPKLVPKMAPI